jgi:hypothetical protein
LNDAAATLRSGAMGRSSSCFSPITLCSSARPRAVGAKNGSVAGTIVARSPSAAASEAALTMPRLRNASTAGAASTHTISRIVKAQPRSSGAVRSLS